MTKIENQKCENLLQQAFTKMKQSHEDFAESENFLKDGNQLEWEVFQRKGDQHYGEAVGIYQALQTLGYKHNRMKELSEMI